MADTYNNQLIAAADEMTEAVMAMAAAMAVVGGGSGNTTTAVMATATRRQWQCQWLQWAATAATL